MPLISRYCTLGLVLAVLAVPVQAQTPARPLVAIIIDDVGYALDVGKAMVDLPGDLTYSVLPFSPYGARLARHAHSAGKEVMLHAPMENLADRALGPGGLTSDMSRPRLLGELIKGMAAVPYCRGINNHMGSLLTQQKHQMTWIMQELLLQRMFFIDSKTTADTVAWQAAEEAGLPYALRDVFLDHQRDTAAIEAAFEKLIRVARRQGRALAIGHPYPETLKVLRERLHHLLAEDMQLVSASVLAHRQYQALISENREALLAQHRQAD